MGSCADVCLRNSGKWPPETYIMLKRKTTVDPKDIFFLQDYDNRKNLAIIERDFVGTAWHLARRNMDDLYNSRKATKGDAWYKTPMTCGEDDPRVLLARSGVALDNLDLKFLE